jgi:tryptophan-rich sensory protein
MEKRITYKVLIISCVAVFAIAFIGGLFTSGNTNSSWYLENKSSITPPGFVFPIVWNILYFLIALSLYFAWTGSKKSEKGIIMLSFGANLILNALWSLLFFEMKNPLIALIDLIFLWGTIVWMIFVVGRIDKKAGWMLVPYLLWVSFASILNFSFML